MLQVYVIWSAKNRKTSKQCIAALGVGDCAQSEKNVKTKGKTNKRQTRVSCEWLLKTTRFDSHFDNGLKEKHVTARYMTI